MPKEFNLIPETDPLSIEAVLIALGLGALMSIAIRWHFKKFGSTLSNREEFSKVLPFVLLTTILIITVVKSSLALSLGLIGALSIVWFRTPIKEPEELAYSINVIARLPMSPARPTSRRPWWSSSSFTETTVLLRSRSSRISRSG